jgi:hypothetical protein
MRHSINSMGQPEIQFLAQRCHFIYVVITVQLLYKLRIFHHANALK